jgi:hypothetical protein
MDKDRLFCLSNGSQGLPITQNLWRIAIQPLDQGRRSRAEVNNFSTTLNRDSTAPKGSRYRLLFNYRRCGDSGCT